MKALVTLNSRFDRERAAQWCMKLPPGTRVEFKATRRSLPQNDKFWALLSDVAVQLKWHGQKLNTSDWRLIFLDALRREDRLVPNIDGTGFVSLKASSSDLSKGEMSDLIELITAFAINHNVKLKDDNAAQTNDAPEAAERGASQGHDRVSEQAYRAIAGPDSDAGGDAREA